MLPKSTLAFFGSAVALAALAGCPGSNNSTVETVDGLQISGPSILVAGQTAEPFVLSLDGDPVDLGVFKVLQGENTLVAEEVMGTSWAYTPPAAGSFTLEATGTQSQGIEDVRSTATHTFMVVAPTVNVDVTFTNDLGIDIDIEANMVEVKYIDGAGASQTVGLAATGLANMTASATGLSATPGTKIELWSFGSLNTSSPALTEDSQVDFTWSDGDAPATVVVAPL